MSRIPLLLLLAALPCAAVAQDCAFRADRALDVDPAGLSRLQLDTGAGDLVVEGVADLAKIEVRGKACASTQALLDATTFEQRRAGEVVVVGTRIPQVTDGGLFGDDEYAWIDLRVRVPAQLALALNDSSGDLEVGGMKGGLSLKDSSGDIRLHDLGGGVHVADTSGDIEARRIDGDFTIDADSSGDIDVDTVSGDAVVREDSSGDIRLAHVGGSAQVDRDSSGDIVFDDIGRDAVVGVDSSGGIRAGNVRGNFVVGSKSGGANAISHHDVAGKVTLPEGG
jgi:hypothetical protein